MSKHTPGPWTAKQWNDNANDITGWSVVDSEGRMLPESEMTGDIEEAEANAHLKAASPDLLEAAKEALEYLESWKDLGGSRAYRMLDSAIQKATGEAL